MSVVIPSTAIIDVEPIVSPGVARGVQYPTKKKRFISSAIVAIVLAALVNAALSFSGIDSRFDPYAFSYRCWPVWLMTDLKEHPVHHNAAVLGSSLMASAVMGCDAWYLNRDLDQSQYHGASYVGHVLETKFGGTFNTLDLAIPGLNPSDAYLAIKAALGLGQHPDVLIYGIAPRDFIDSTLLSPVDTETYHYLSRVVNVDPLAPKLFKDPQSKLNRLLEKDVFLYGKSFDIQLAGTKVLQRFIDTLLPTPPTSHPFTFWDRQKLLPEYKKTEIVPTGMIASPKEQRFDPTRFTDNTKDYINRYKNPRKEIFETQLFFLKQVSDLCKQNGIKLVLVNMPITVKNVNILGMPKYNEYWARVKQFGTTEDISLLDLNDFKKYDIEDFQDLVHLNGYGAKKFFDALGDALAKDPKTSAVCTSVAENSRKH